MSLKLSFCLRAIKTLDDQDLNALTEKIEANVKSGMETPQAELSAVEDLLASLAEERNELLALIKAQHPEKAAPSKNKIFTDEAAEAARAVLRGKLANLNKQKGGIDPEVFQAGITLAGYHIEKGARTFAAYAKAMVEDLGEVVLPYLKSWYAATYFDPRAADMQADMTPPAYLDKAAEAAEEQGDVRDPDTGVERDSGDAGDVQREVGEALSGRGLGEGPQTHGTRTGSARRGRPDDAGVPTGRASPVRELGDQPVRGGERQEQPSLFDAGTVDGERSDDPGITGVQPDPKAREQAQKPASAWAGAISKREAQKAADSIPMATGIENIRATLPYLQPGQQDDVAKAEERFSKPEGYGMLFTNGTGTGKAQPLDAKLMTPAGWIRMGDVRVGDFVLGADGKPTRVLAVYPQGEKDIYKVSFSDGATTECCHEHLWLTQTLYERRKASEAPHRKSAQPQVRDLLEISMSVGAQHFVPIAKPLQFDQVSLPIPPYAMGAILGDGCISQNSIILSTADPELAERMAADLPGELDLRLVADGKRCPSYAVRQRTVAHNERGHPKAHQWMVALEEMGLRGRKSETKFVPEIYLRGSVAQRTALLQGLMDIDGWVDVSSGGAANFTSVSGKLVDAVCFLARSLGGTAKVSVKHPTYEYKGQKMNGQEAFNVRMNLPAGVEPFSLPRKIAQYRPNAKYFPRRYITAVDRVGRKEAQCIAVDSPDHLYVTDDCIVTHNTFSGLGIVKRFVRSGKGNVLIVVPDVKIMEDWIDSGTNLGLKIKALNDTKDAGQGVTITTYANLGENDALATRSWDLVVPDEVHMLMQSADAMQTKALDKLRAITLHPRGVHERMAMFNRKDVETKEFLEKAVEQVSDRAHLSELTKQLDRIREKLAKELEKVRQDVMSRQGEKRTRVAGLSATPFAYEKTVDWADGYLFDYAQSEPLGDETARERFFMQHFGYRMSRGKLTEPESTVDRGLMQRQFNGWLKNQGVLSGRMLDVEADYDRRFILAESSVGNEIDRAIEWIREKAQESRAKKTETKDLKPSEKEPVSDGWEILNAELNNQLFGPTGHLVRRYLLEAIKAKEVVKHIRDHMAIGRKVVVFHDFKKGGAINPFEFEPLKVPTKLAEFQTQESFDKVVATIEARNARAEEFKAEFPMLSGDVLLADLVSPIERFKSEMPDVLLINGDEKKSDLLARYKRFNDDSAGPMVALVQSAKNKGWSGHDTTGKHQRVLFNLGLPTQPTMSIQQEGRIYRTGQVSNAIFRYLNTGTNWERWAFAQTIADRASAAENLATGELARALKDAFIAGFEESGDFPAGHEGEGTGGKARDAAANNAVSEYDRAKSFYFGTAKKTAKTKAQEGVDYFATPEPVGFKMVQMLDLRGGEDALEPSAGHGAIARWFPETANRTAVEPSNTLGSRLAMVFDGKIVRGDFEELNVVNKFDGIAMNPPFGTAGRTAIDHLAKAAQFHLREGGRLAAIIPTGPAADKKFEKWFYEDDTRQIKPMFEHPTLGPIYRGDTIKSKTAWASAGRVVGRPAGGAEGVMVRTPGSNYDTMVTLESIISVDQTGPRTQTYRPAEGLQLVADIKMPAVTFERAGTKVMTRIVVIEKLKDGANLAETRKVDYSGIEDINELFDRMEDLTLPTRAAAPDKAEVASEPEQKKKTKKAEAAAADAAAAKDSGIKVIKHTTGAGKVIEGVIRTDLTKDQAKQVDEYTFKKDGGFFIRVRHVAELNKKFPLANMDLGRQEVLGPQVIEDGVSKRDIEAVADLQNKLNSVNRDKITLTAMPAMARPGLGAPKEQTNRYAATELVRVLFNKRVVFFSADKGAVNGAALGSQPRVLFVNEATRRPVLAVLGHEALHQMRRDEPQLYDRLSERLDELVKNPGEHFMELVQRYTDRGIAIPDVEKIREELVADIVGDNFTDPAFWRALQDGQPGLFQRILKAVRDFLNDVLERLRNERPFGTDKYLSDVVAARDAVVKAMQYYAASNAAQTVKQASASKQGAVNLSAGDYVGPTMAEIESLSSTPTVEIMREAIDVVGEKEFERRAQQYIHEMTRGGKFKVSESMLIEATARGIVALERRKKGDVSLSAGDVTDTEAFKRWFGKSKVVDAQGKPLVVYHGTASDITEFDGRSVYEGGIYFAQDPRYATGRARIAERMGHGPAANLMPAFVRITNPAPAEMSVAQAKDEGYDGIIRGNEVVAFKPEQIKSATGNRGTFDPNESDISLSVDRHTPEQRQALARAGIDTRSRLRRAGDKIRELYGRSVEAWKDNWGRQFQQSYLDQFTGIAQVVERELGGLPVDQDPYVAARLANGGTSSVMRGLLLHGQAKWAENGQHLEKIPKTRGLLDILAPLGDDLNDFFGWMIGNRAARLAKEGRERNLTPAQIETLQGLAKGKEDKFRAAALEYAAFKRSVLDIAQHAGLIDGEARKVWDNADYIPFYRKIDQEAVFTATGKKGLAGQSSGIRTLKGGESALNDPLENIIMNFSRLVDASLKNRAIAKTVNLLEEAGSDVVTREGMTFSNELVPAGQVKKVLRDAGTPDVVMDIIPDAAFTGMAKMWAMQPPVEPDIVRVMVGGSARYYRVNDPLLLKALTSFVPFDFPGLGVLRAFKRILTAGVTAAPPFWIRNFVRDTAAAQLVGRDGFFPGKSVSGIVKSYLESGAGEAMLFSGASFQSGQVNAGDPAGTGTAIRRALRRRGFNAATAEGFLGTVIDTPARWWEHYRHVGESVENANREAIYEATVKAGKGATAAAFESKDLMDFTLRGSSPVYQFMADVLPFFNARVQGLYRLGRSNPKRLAAYGMLMMAASLALAWANEDNDEYNELPDWDKDNYWHFWIRGEHFRLPKPFELGVAFATIPERLMRYIRGQDTGKKAASRITHDIIDQLAFDPVPQAIRPALNVAMNRDTFRDRPIENMSDERKDPVQRYSATTSPAAVELTKAASSISNATGIGPKKLEYLVNAYFGTVGAYALGVADLAVQSAMDRPPGPTKRLDELPMIREFYRQDPARATVYEQDLFTLRAEVERLYNTVRDMAKKGDKEGAKEMAKEESVKLALGPQVKSAAEMLQDLNKKRDAIYANRTMTPEQKRIEIDKILKQRALISRKVMTNPVVRSTQ